MARRSNAQRQAAYRARMRNLTPVQRILRDLPEAATNFTYTSEELHQIRTIRCLVRQAEEGALSLNGTLLERLGRGVVDANDPMEIQTLNRLLEELEKGFTRITLAVF